MYASFSYKIKILRVIRVDPNDFKQLSVYRQTKLIKIILQKRRF